MWWWLWVLLGLGLLGLELVTPGAFVGFFFGLSALLVGVLAGVGILDETWVQWAAFSLVSILALVVLRKPLQARLNVGNDNMPVNDLVGEQVMVTVAVPAGGSGRVEHRGTTWTARTKGEATIPAGAHCRVEAVDGVTLWVKTE